MGIKDKMMDRYMDKMTKEEKVEMMDSMMERFLEDFTPEEKAGMMETMMGRFLGDFTPEERQDMMLKMMPRMMEGMDFAQMMPMMMSQMMGGMSRGAMSSTPEAAGEEDGPMPMAGFNPPDMCRRMVEGMTEMVETNKAILAELQNRPV